ncbi:MAG: dihydrofolate reductase family protein [Rhodothermales bacterium]
MRDLIYYVAVSIDGYIAEADGTFGRFVWDDDVVADFFASYEWFDTVVMGRKTYDVALLQGITDPYPNLKGYVFSKTLKTDPDPNMALVQGDVVEHVTALKKEAGKPIWLCGGGDLAGQLLEAKLIDQLIIKLNPVILGGGIPIFSNITTFARLNPTEIKEYDCGISLRHYTVSYE